MKLERMLEPGTASTSSMYCDICGAVQQKGAPLLSCRRHDFDVCASCAARGEATADGAAAAPPACRTCSYTVPPPAPPAAEVGGGGGGDELAALLHQLLPPPPLPACRAAENGSAAEDELLAELPQLLRRLAELGSLCGRVATHDDLAIKISVACGE